jgi:hypothetical protein
LLTVPSPKESAVATPPVIRLQRQLTLPCSLVLLFALCVGSVRVDAAQVGFVSPVLTSVVASPVQSSAIPVAGSSEMLVSGVGFTPGGLVYIAVHDQWAKIQHETRWVTASVPVLQPPQDLAPGAGFSVDSGGNIGEFFDIPVTVTTFPGDTQNPALGPVTSQSVTMPGIECAVSLMVQAYDRSTATWSNLVEVELGC